MYYKVISRDLKSIVIQNPNFAVQYKINEWVQPTFKGSALCVFDNLKDAKCFALGDPIYECKVKNPRQPVSGSRVKGLYPSTLFMQIVWSKIIEYKNKHNKIKEQDHADWPKGTVWVSAVKLTKKVQ